MTKGEVLALTRIRGSQASPERRIVGGGAPASDKDALRGLQGSERGLIPPCHGGIIIVKGDEG